MLSLRKLSFIAFSTHCFFCCSNQLDPNKVFREKYGNQVKEVNYDRHQFKKKSGELNDFSQAQKVNQDWEDLAGTLDYHEMYYDHIDIEKAANDQPRNFLPNQEVIYFVFTNQDLNIKSDRSIVKIDVEHKKWPWMTLGRYQIFTDNYESLSSMDYLYYCDADMRFVDVVGDEILSDRVATQHCGYYKVRGIPESNPNSLAYVAPNEEMEYLAGGFNGGTSVEYLKMSKVLSDRINDDFSRGIIAIWHDESHMNRYFIDNKPTLLLDPSYCFHEGSTRTFKRKLLALSKNHSEIRD